MSDASLNKDRGYVDRAQEPGAVGFRSPDSDLSELLRKAACGEKLAAAQLLPRVYDDLRRLASRELTKEPTGQTLQPTALVHEVYLRLVGRGDQPIWHHRRHFYAAAALAMRRILVERARHKGSLQAGGEYRRISIDGIEFSASARHPDLLALDEALDRVTISR